MEYSGAGLRAAHFQGFVPLKSLARSDVLGPRGGRDVEGVYVVLRPARTRPEFIEDDHPKPRPPVMKTADVAKRWPEENAEILYIGKAPLRGREGERRDGLAKRMLELQKCGLGTGRSHFGGRLIWRIADRGSLLICWKCLPEDTAADVESLMIAGFRESNGRHLPPFANIGAAKKRQEQKCLSLIDEKGC
jgi:hypothetical protein